MNPYKYQAKAFETESRVDAPPSVSEMRLVHAALGLQTESAEFSDMLKRSLFYGTRVDRINALEEMGDILWYMAIVLSHFDSTFEEVMEANICKLQFRYPEKFDTISATVRQLHNERQILQKILG